MKRRDLVKEIQSRAAAAGLNVEFSEGRSHTKVKVGERQTVIPRHREVNEHTAAAILKHLFPEGGKP